MSLRKIGAVALRRMMGGWRAEGSRVPAYREIEQSLKLLILDGQLPIGVRLPGERNLSPGLGVSLTSITAAYAALMEGGFLE
ncbi:MAG: GntR family transcriptional regulator, partial [Sphingomonas sp.]|nr:GntR family transcriptional regulator [Sphingomonas sp.]